MTENSLAARVTTPEDLERALDELERLMASDPDPGSDAGIKLDTLATLIESYEQEHFPI